MRKLNSDQIRELHSAIVQGQIINSIGTLLVGLDLGIKSKLPKSDDPSTQLFLVIDHLNDYAGNPGKTHPLITFLENTEYQLGERELPVAKIKGLLSHVSHTEIPQANGNSSPQPFSESMDSEVRKENESTTVPPAKKPASGTGVNTNQSTHITLVNFSKEDWKRLEELLQRTELARSSREALLIKVFDGRIGVGAIADLLHVPGAQDFFQKLNYTIKTVGDDGVFRRYLESLQGYVLNQSDLDWLKSRLEPDDPPSVEPDTFGVVLEALVSLLQSDKALLDALLAATSAIGQEYFQKPSATADDLVRGILSHPFPLQCFSAILTHFYLQKKRLSNDSAMRTLHICKAYFRSASLPAEDKQVVYVALKDAFLASEKSSRRASMPIQTANKQFAEDLLISTWIQVSQRSLEKSEIYKLIHREPISGDPITDADRIVFATVRILSQPTDPDNSSRLSIWFAKCCWQELMGTSVMPDDPIYAVNNFISQMAKLKAATAMLITKDRIEAIQELKKTFPQLVLIPLSETDAKRYSEILTEMSIIEKLISQICSS
jgi:hypothetical protein